MVKKLNGKKEPRTITKILADLEKIAEEYFMKNQNNINPAHQWDHVQRVIKATDQILEYEPKANRNKAKIATILHDIGRYQKEGDHAYWSADIAKSILTNELSEDEIKNLNIKIDEIVKIIKYHSKKPEEVPGDLKNDLELKILTVADKIDMFGALGIVRAPLDERFQKSYKVQIDHITEKADPNNFIFQTNGGMEVGKRYKDYLNDFLKEYYFQKNQFEK